jgi:hypothetical protein
MTEEGVSEAARPYATTALDVGEEQSAVRVPRVWLSKGTMLPVDLGFEGTAQGRFTHAAGYLQWTLYEALARPALATRVGYGRTFGLAGTELTSTSVDAAVSYGFLRYFTLYGSYGVAREQARLDGAALQATVVPESGTLTGPSPRTPEAIDKSWFDSGYAAGLQITVVPPFVHLTGEVAAQSGRPMTVAAKLAFGM